MWRVWWCKNDWALFTIFQARTSARTYRQGSLNLQGFWIYIFVFELVKHFTFVFLDFQQELLYASNWKRYLFFGYFECWFFYSYRKFTSQSHRATKTTYLVILILVFSYHLMIIIMHAAFCSEMKEKLI